MEKGELRDTISIILCKQGKLFFILFMKTRKTHENNFSFYIFNSELVKLDFISV